MADGAAAYQRLKAPTDKLSQSIQYWGAQHNRQAQQNMARQERQQVRNQQRVDKLNNSLGEDISAIAPVITGVKSVDEINYRATANAQQRIGDIYRKFKQDPSSQSDVNLRMELANLKQFPKTLKETEGKITAYAKDFQEGYISGKYSKWDEDKLDELEAFFGVKGEDGKITPNYIIDFDKSGNMQAKAMTKDGKYFTKSVNDVLSGVEYGVPTQSIKADSYAADIAKGLGKKQELIISGGFSKVVQDFSQQEQGVREMIAASLGDAEDPSSIAKSVWADEMNMGRSKGEFNKGSIKQIEDYLVEKVALNYDETISVKQLRAPKSTNSDDSGKGNIFLMKDSKTGKPLKQVIEGPTKKGESREMSEVAFGLKKPVTTGVGNKEKKINQLYLDNNDNILFKGEEKVTTSGTEMIGGVAIPGGKKETKYQEVVGGGINQEELNIVAIRAGFNNATELKDHLKQLKKEGEDLVKEGNNAINKSKPLEEENKKLAESMRSGIKSAKDAVERSKAAQEKYGY